MDNQFNDLSEPSIDEEYYCIVDIRSKGFTHLMKLVLVVRKFPEAVEMIKEIITNKPLEINKTNQRGFSALMLSVMYSSTYSNVETVKLLINAGADVNCTFKIGDGNEYTPLIMASQIASSTSNNEIVKLLINAGADINAMTNLRYTALIKAIMFYNATNGIDTIKILIDAGADVNITGKDIGSALIVLLRQQYHNIDIVKMLIDAGADVNAKSCHYCVPAITLANSFEDKNFNINCMKMLINAGADVNAKDILGDTCLMMLCRYSKSDRLEKIKMLIEAGADVNIKNLFGNTALMYLINKRLSKDDKEVLLILMNLSKSTISDKNNNNQTAYDRYIRKIFDDILDETELKILKGEIEFNNTKTARY